MVTVIGAGLARCEAAWQAANRGVHVTVYDMKPDKKTPAHHGDNLAELVCSNSLRSDSLSNAAGLLKEEMRRMNSLIISCADQTRIPAGSALAVDRDGFAALVTEKIKQHPNIKLVLSTQITEIPDGIVIIASGPLTSNALLQQISRLTNNEHLFFFDAAAPIVTYESVDMQIAYRASRYNKGGDDYINCPMDTTQYELFLHELVNAEQAAYKEFDNNVFEGCMPIEVMAKRGQQTLLYGPLKPVGLCRPDGQMPHAVVQLRQDNATATLYNMVGFQTRITFAEQKRVFSLIPGLENAEFVRYGVMHKNTFINSPCLLLPTYQLKTSRSIFFAGQITGVEGYIESASSGLVAGINAANKVLGVEPFIFDTNTAIGALAAYVSNDKVKNFQPMNINFGLLPPLEVRIKAKQQRNTEISERALRFLPTRGV
ncbi:MAG: methylenetetrahydrofolate--tRNA-(uracil(54)-C(5))-methyltransferase (FADH(2)-oxidizing) TrmFO [Clostridiaceae bacterium]|nr:methylenetetrahydrofolate--tRNA-(uracil(54)-C(5))-methyltransferase (FADH(2)-oxidizing) TrmFO [Clostridiaceae bacterium]